MRGVGNRRLLELVGETLALSDLERFTEAFIVRPETQESANERLVSAMAFAGPRKGAVQLEEAGLRSSADETAREKTEAAGSCGVRGRGTDHHRADNVQETHHLSWLLRLVELLL